MSTPTGQSVNFAAELRSGRHYGVFIDDKGSPGLKTPGLHEQPEETLWADALSEFAGDSRRPGLWAKAFATADGDEAKAKARYLQLRVLTGAVHKRHADGRCDVFVHIREGIKLQAEVGDVIVTITDAQGNHVQQPTPPPRIVTISALAAKNAAVTKAMRLFAAPDVKTWVGLYRLHEVIEADVGGEHSLQKKDWGSKHDLKRFKHSANSVKVAGDAARHGNQHDQPPSNPMTIEEAVAYANYVLHAWLASKGA